MKVAPQLRRNARLLCGRSERQADVYFELPGPSNSSYLESMERKEWNEKRVYGWT